MELRSFFPKDEQILDVFGELESDEDFKNKCLDHNKLQEVSQSVAENSIEEETLKTSTDERAPFYGALDQFMDPLILATHLLKIL
jgi:hypothetical protein